MRFRSTVVAVGAVILSAVSPALTADAAPEPVASATVAPATEATSQVIVTYNSPANRAPVNSTMSADDIDTTVQRNFQDDSVVVDLGAMTSPDEVNNIMSNLATQPNVVSVVPDVVMKRSQQEAPKDTFWAYQWSLMSSETGDASAIGVEQAWNVTRGSEDVYIAVIDTGIIEHSDLTGRWVGGYDFVSNPTLANDGDARDDDPHDPGDWIDQDDLTDPLFDGCPIADSSWHGTKMAGVIGAATNNNLGIAGINPVSKLVPVRALGKCFGFASDIADAITWSAGLPVAETPANPHKADVINMSLEAQISCNDPAFASVRSAITNAIAADVTLVAAAGNNELDASANAPANCDGVIAVASTSKNGDKARYSAFGDTVAISAPGGDKEADGQTIFSTTTNGTTAPAGARWSFDEGTSFSAAHVSGVVSLMKSVNPNLPPAEITKALTRSARPFPADSTCTGICGAGMLDAQGAVVAARSRLNNLAPNGTATQSSTYRDQVAERAIDGNTDGTFKAESSSHTLNTQAPHWDLELAATSKISDIVVWARTDCCQSRIQNFWVFASNQPFSSTNPEVLNNDPTVKSFRITESPSPEINLAMDDYEAKYIRVQMVGKEFLQLAEVQVFGEQTGTPNKLDNLAPAGTASQSSTWRDQVASRANDGKTDGTFDAASSSHTLNETHAYWDLELDASATIDKVVVWARTDCCAERLNDFWVFASNEPFTSTNPGVLSKDPNVSANRIRAIPSPNAIAYLRNFEAKFVRIQHASKNFLQLAEVEVFGVRTEKPVEEVNLARAGTASQSSTWGGQEASRANDGKTDGTFDAASSSHTLNETHAYWDLKLDASATIDKVVVWARTDCCAERLNDYWVFVSNQPFTSTNPGVLSQDPNVNATRVRTVPRPNQVVYLNDYKGKYIRVQHASKNFLQLAEVEVIGPKQ